jgi:adenosylcobinamide kinase/adenosylcobinamide-phosphate guanylyltransferase
MHWFTAEARAMGRLTLITGGAASGKSTHALRVAAQHGAHILFVATCIPRDDEMQAKVERHRHERPRTWTTVEASRNLGLALAPGFDAAVVDCLTLLVSQLLIDELPDSDILAEVDSLCQAARAADYPVLLVTGEVGQGIVPEHELARRFRELAGRANQLAASQADEVELLVSGIAVRIKHAG